MAVTDWSTARAAALIGDLDEAGPVSAETANRARRRLEAGEATRALDLVTDAL